MAFTSETAAGQQNFRSLPAVVRALLQFHYKTAALTAHIICMDVSGKKYEHSVNSVLIMNGESSYSEYKTLSCFPSTGLKKATLHLVTTLKLVNKTGKQMNLNVT